MNTNTTLEPVPADGDDSSAVCSVVEETLESIQPVIRIREEHNISRRDIDPDALKVLYRLARNNFIAYLVGGGVRDLLLGRKPKDFDVSTNAKPEQIRSLFRNCILIGRRFRLAHVRYGEKIIETSTFRTTPKIVADPTDPEADLFQRDDNLFGSPQEDALRRDFTVNGLFYDIESFSIIDYVGGMEDLAARRIRCIGDPCIRFREDPVRMVRAVRFASRLGFTFDPDTEDAIHKHGEELAKAAPARLLEEITRLFAFSSGESSVRLLNTTGLLRVILPEVADCLDSDALDHGLFWRRLEALDKGDTVLPDATPALIFAVLLQDALKVHMGKDWSFEDSPRLKFDKVHAFLEPLAERLRFPRKLVDRIVHMYITQHRFTQSGSRGKRGYLANFVTQDAFHESLALAEIILTSEGGSQSRLNQWRDMLAERIYGRDDHHHHHNNNGGTGANNSHDRRQRAEPVSVPNAEDGEVPAATENADVMAVDEESPRKLSRSARRRRNKRIRRQRSPEEVGAERQAAEAEGTAPAPVAADPEKPEVEVKAEEPVQEKRASGRGRSNHRNNGGRGKRREEEPRDRETPVKAESPVRVESQVESEPAKPLTASAFWMMPEPEPEPEAEPVKKKRGGRKKSEKKPAAKSAGEVEPDKNEPLRPDRADEANTPMHWLDEI